MKSSYKFSLIALLAALLFGGYYFLNQKQKREQAGVWNMIPESALTVYESEKTVSAWNHLLQTAVWKNLANIGFFEKLAKDFEGLDTACGKEGKLDRLLRHKPLYISVHLKDKDEQDAVFYMDIKDPDSRQTVQEALSFFKKNKNIRFASHTYKDISIQDLTDERARAQFSYFIHKDFFVGSFSSFLVEDVIRTMLGSAPKLPVEPRKNFLNNSDGKLFVNTRQLKKWLSAYTKHKLPGFINRIGDFSLLDINFSDRRIFLNGKTYTKHNPENFLNSFQEPGSNSSELFPYISNYTGLLLRIGTGEFESWRQRIPANAQTEIPDNIANRFQLRKPWTIEWIGDELAFAQLESINPKQPELIAYVQTPDPQNARHYLNSLSEQLSPYAVSFSENYCDVPIGFLNLPQAPQLFFGDTFKGFAQVYYAVVKQTVVFANSLQGIKRVIYDIEHENTWGKSIQMHRFLNETLQESNLSVIINTNRIWSQMQEQLNPRWKTFAEQNAFPLKQLHLMSFEFLYDAPGRFTTSAVAEISKLEEAVKSKDRFVTLESLDFHKKTLSKPFIVKGRKGKGLEVVAQLEDSSICLIDARGELLWDRPLVGPLVGKVFQVDFYKNSLLQYALSTPEKLYIIDRLGREVEEFPLTYTPLAPVSQFSLIDYDGSKNYRFASADAKGNIWLFDKKGKALEGWKPKALGKPLTMPLNHVRIRKRDVMIALQENGKLHLFNRRGEVMKGFPVDVDAKINGPAYIQKGSSFGNSFISFVTEHGKLYQYSFEGKLRHQFQFYKPGRDSHFSLCPDGLNKTFVIVRRNRDHLSILNREGEMLFETNIPNASRSLVQYYAFDVSHQIIAVTDQEQGFTYLYDHTGKLINGLPVGSDFEIGLLYSAKNKSYKLYHNYKNQFIVSEF